jgi:hypothetical protein
MGLVLLSELARMGPDELGALLDEVYSVEGGGLTDADTESNLIRIGFKLDFMTHAEFAALPKLRSDGRPFINLNRESFSSDDPLGISATKAHDDFEDIPNVRLSLPRSGIIKALLSIGLD